MGIKLFDGKARKITLPLILLSGAGWIVFVIAFGWLNRNEHDDGTDLSITLTSDRDDEKRLHERWFSFWAFAVCSPVLYLLAVAHLLTGQWYIGFFSHLLTAVFLVSGGGILFWNGVTIAYVNELGDAGILDALFGISTITDYAGGRFIVLEFSGCLIAVLFMSLAMSMWPFFTDVNNYECIGYQRDTSPANTVAPATIPPHMYVAVPGQAIPMQPMAFAQQQAYPQFGVYPAAMPHASASEDKTNLVSE